LIPKAKVASFVSSLESNLRAKYKDDKDFAIVWNNVRSTFTPVKSNKYSSGQMVGDTIYLDRSLQPKEAQILTDSGASNAVYLD